MAPNLYRSFPTWIISLIFVLFQFTLQLSSGSIVNELKSSFNISMLKASLLTSTFYYIYVVMQMPSGMIVDRFGARFVLTTGALICGIGCFIFSTSQYIFLATIGRILMGGGASFAFVACIYIVKNKFNKKYFSLMIGITESVGMLAVLFGNIIISYLIYYTTWRFMMYYCGIFSIILSMFCWFIIDDGNKNTRKTTFLSNSQFISRVLYLLKSKIIWINGAYCGILFSIVTVFSGLWYIPFLLQKKFTLHDATLTASFLYAGISIGGPLIGYFSHFIKKSTLLVISSITSTIFLISLIWLPISNYLLLSSLNLLLGISCVGYILNFTISDYLAPQGTGTTAIGITNTLCVISAPILQPLIGWIIDRNLNNGIQNIINYQIALSIIPLLTIVSAFLGTKLKYIEKNNTPQS